MMSLKFQEVKFRNSHFPTLVDWQLSRMNKELVLMKIFVQINYHTSERMYTVQFVVVFELNDFCTESNQSDENEDDPTSMTLMMSISYRALLHLKKKLTPTKY